MPQVVSGLDNLKETKVHALIEEVYRTSSIKVTVFMEALKDFLHKREEVVNSHDYTVVEGTPEGLETLKTLTSAQRSDPAVKLLFSVGHMRITHQALKITRITLTATYNMACVQRKSVTFCVDKLSAKDVHHTFNYLCLKF